MSTLKNIYYYRDNQTPTSKPIPIWAWANRKGPGPFFNLPNPIPVWAYLNRKDTGPFSDLRKTISVSSSSSTRPLMAAAPLHLPTQNRCSLQDWRKAIAFIHKSIVSDRKAAIFLSFQSFWLVVSISVVHTAALNIAFPYFHGSVSSHSWATLIKKVVSLSLSWRSVSSPEWALCSSSVV